jgi:predicted 3-demethylubiquinone-9 3-methyltransferase (glyoxalase superfamily)
MINKITPCLWFDKELPVVIDYYKGIFKENLVLVSLGELNRGPGGEYQCASIEIFGSKYDLLAAGPMFKFTEAISLTIHCDNQDETDFYWNALTANGGAESFCGWCKDKYGLSWQVVPKRFFELMSSSDKETCEYTMQQLFKMKKIIIKDLEK